MDLLTWAIVFAVISLVAGALGFTGIAGGANRIARLLFGLFLAIAVVLLILALVLAPALTLQP
jgi:uncharacterized membrane protein YtjA (UPF0391 family)